MHIPFQFSPAPHPPTYTQNDQIWCLVFCASRISYLRPFFLVISNSLQAFLLRLNYE
ncbi:hypothetical protein LguiA_020649 [Lonicera macranthoides]